MCTTIIIGEVCPHGWLVRFLHNANYASLFAMEHGKLHVLVNMPLKQYFKRYKQQKMTFSKL